MKNVPRYIRIDSSNLWETYDEVAAFLTDGVMSSRATQKAIHE